MKKLRDIFVKEWKDWWRYWSNRLAMLAGVIAVWAVDNRAEVLDYVTALPSPYRQIVTFLLVAVVPIIVRMMRQPKLENSDGV